MVKLDIMENIRQDIRKVIEGRKNGGTQGGRVSEVREGQQTFVCLTPKSFGLGLTRTRVNALINWI